MCNDKNITKKNVSSFNVQKSERACVFKEMCTNRLNGRSVLIFVCACVCESIILHSTLIAFRTNEMNVKVTFVL